MNYIQQLEDMGLEEAPYGYADGGMTEVPGAEQVAPEQVDEYRAQIQNEVGDADISPEDAEDLYQVFVYMLKNPEKYSKIRGALVKEDVVDAEDLPEEYDAQRIGSMISVFGELKAAKGAAQQEMPQYADGGAVADLAARGRGGDTMLAHVNKDEAALLKVLGGAGTINPETGLPEYKNRLKKAVKSVVKGVGDVAKKVVSSPIGKVVATAGLAAIGVPPTVGGAIVGGISSAKKGAKFGDILKGAATGAAMGYVGGKGLEAVRSAGGVGAALSKGIGSLGGAAKTAANALNLGSLFNRSAAPAAPESSWGSAEGWFGGSDSGGSGVGGGGWEGGDWGAAGTPGAGSDSNAFLDALKKMGSGAIDYIKANPGKVMSVLGGAALGAKAAKEDKPSGGGVATAYQSPGQASAAMEQTQYGPIMRYAAQGGLMQAYANGGVVRPFPMQDGGFVYTKKAVDGAGGPRGLASLVPNVRMIRGKGTGTSDSIPAYIQGKRGRTPARVSNGEAYAPPGGSTLKHYALMKALERRAA